ncbi:glucose-6-phosphate isomerase [Kangiella geojedonensis]|uniref:Glucose-6-phosphate isomerase n=1 Tax=Kangiella geojedonensis TaxID=914150 RepID=A0A0F6TRL3_9GAMM|nr:glucose-6-phosphate isomerase [Kangiella geojedonensis]AKE52342.1 Glucose-6-phosphate isomerase [Kangiella geojedonensis]
MDTHSKVVRALQNLSRDKDLLNLDKLFACDAKRNDWLFKSWEQFTFDFTKQLVSKEILTGLLELAESRKLKNRISGLIAGKPVNTSEDRPALHTALRMPKSKSLVVNQTNVVADVHGSLERVKGIVDKIHSGQWRGYSGKPITDIVNIGVGGSDLGPFMVTNALKDFQADWKNHLDFHFVSSMDGTQIFKLLETLNPETCLFIISSKSFTTIDTFYNANTAMEWMLGACPDKSLVVKQHFIGVSASPDKMNEWGIAADNQLLFWDWVGGRFSLWSAIGLPIALSVGMDNFEALLSGAHEMDKQFATAPFEDNIPVLLGLIGVWNATFLNINAHTVLPYDGRLQFLPNYLTQLEMESNGKAVTMDGKKVEYKTCPILWGDIGPNAQHAFYQLLHQGTQKVSCDFIAPINRYHDTSNGAGTDEFLIKQHKLSLANCLAQSRVLAFGNKAVSDDENLPAHKFYNGNQPSTTILMDELNPYTLGSLIALYEHKVFVMASIWGINPFDQWGVELGKVIAGELLDAIQGDPPAKNLDISTQTLLDTIKNKA